MVLQYSAVGIQNISHMATTRDDYMRDIERLGTSIGYAMWNCPLDLPVKLVAISEGGIGGWCLAGGEKHLELYNTVIPEIGGPETEVLASYAKTFGVYLMAQMVAKDPDFFPDRIFNIGFILDPNGELILKHYKTSFYQKETNTAPSDIWDHYLDLYGDDSVKLFEALYPVAKTDIGNLGMLICAEGSYPEAARGLAMNGAEVIYRTQYPEPWMGNNMHEIQNKSHAIFNTAYVLAPNIGGIYMPGSEDHLMACGRSNIIDYRGNIISEYKGPGETLVSGILNIDGLRDFRVRGQWQNLAKDMRVEEYKVIYDAMMAKGGIYPRNLAMDKPPLTEEQQHELVKIQVNKMVEWGVYTAPPGWEPFEEDPEVKGRVEEAEQRSHNRR